MQLARLVGAVLQTSSKDEAPGPLIQSFNEAIHQPPYALLANGVFWVFFFMFVAPLVGGAYVVVTAVRLVLHFAGWSSERISTDDDELAVVITGCDTGFGKDLAFQLATNGFQVFAGCVKKESFEQYKHQKLITPVVFDVTKDRDAAECARLVESWIWIAGTDAGAGDTKKKRHLHAVVNNAGVGNTGLVDWMEMKDYSFCMDVNCYGMIRTVKAFLPLLKKQAVAQSSSFYEHARIINVTSMAGMVASAFSSPYFVSKHAAEAFSNCLRLEMRDFGIPVVTVNPSFHETPLTDSMVSLATARWQKLQPQQREEYGEEYCSKVFLRMATLPKAAMWRPHIVTQQLTAAVELIRPPPKMAVGLDAKFALMVTRMLPPWLSDGVIPDFGIRPKVLETKPKSE